MKFRSLHFKINLAIVTTALVICLLFVAILYPLEIDRRADQIKRINLLLDTVYKQKINDLANELFSRQERAIKATIQEMQAVDGIVGVCVFDENGRLFLSSNQELHGLLDEEIIRQSAQAPIFENIRHEGHSLQLYANAIAVIGKQIGYIVIYYDLAKLEHESRQAVTLIVALLIAAALLMAVSLNLFLYRSIMRPVSALRNAMRRVEQGHLGDTVHLPGKDEIRDMGKAFNDMSLKLRKGREALIEAEEKYRGIFENAIEGIFQASPDQGRFITVNPAMATILGYGAPVELIEAVSDIGQQLFAREADRREYALTLAQAGRIIGLEAELYTRDGSVIWVSISARRVSDENGRPLYDEGSFVDVTERRQRKEAEREREAAESANRAKSLFLANMSHEIRTPLNAILGFADMLDGTLTDDMQRNYLSVIKSSGTNLLQLINDILDLSKIEAGRMEIKRTAVDLRSLTTELLSLFSMSAARKGIDLRARVDPQVPPFMMLDRARLRQILFNLIGNAVKFTLKGFVEIQVQVRTTDSANLWDLRLDVRDTGPGIEKEAYQLIFQTFHQHHSGRAPATEGTGLGLAISKSLVEMMNGHIEVDSTPDAGSLFSIILPGTVAAIQVGDEAEVTSDVNAVQSAMVFRPAGLLVVDDLEVNRQLLIEYLKDSPLRINETDNGQSAVMMTRLNTPNLVLMDIKMPGLDGYEALELIREQGYTDLPVIAITAAGMKEDIHKITTAGFNDYLIRPFNRTQLKHKLARFLEYDMLPVPTEPQPDRVAGQQAARAPVQSWTCPVEVADLLRSKYSPAWQKIRKRQHIPDIKQFSEELRHLGEQHGIEALARYGETLAGYAETIDIDNLQCILAAFPALLKRMCAQDQSDQSAGRA